MMMKTLETIGGPKCTLINALFDADEDDLPSELADQIITRTYTKGTILQQTHLPLQMIIYVCSGAVRAFELTNYGVRTHRLLSAGDVYFDYSVKAGHSGKRITVQTSEDSVIKMVGYEQLIQISVHSVVVREFLIQLAEKSLFEEVFHRTLLSSNEARTRIDTLKSFFPGFFSGFTQRDLSGYLGIAVESYNRLYHQMA